MTDVPPQSAARLEPAQAGPIPPLRIRGLRLIGPHRDYTVDFTDLAGESRQLAVIAGEISTGKTSILQLIDYCLGAKDHPEHEEIVANVRAAQLSIEVREALTEHDVDAVSDDADWPRTQLDPDVDREVEASSTYVATRYIIERPIGGASKVAWLLHGDLEESSEFPPRSLSLDPADPDSLSQFLLSVCGLGGLRVKAAPTQEESTTSILSFRDVMPLWFLTNRRMDNADLVLENQPPKSLKLRQVIDYFFGVGDEESSALAEQIDVLRKDIRAGEAGVRALRAFFADAGIGDLGALEDETDNVRAKLAEAQAELTLASQRLTARTDFASELRDDFGRATTETRQTEAQLRDRRTLLRRLDPLRSQYADDLRKLEMLEESQQLFGSLDVVTCPACQSALESPPHITNGCCSLCLSRVDDEPIADAKPSDKPTEQDADQIDQKVAVSEEPLSVARERRSVRRRVEQLKSLIGEVAAEVRRLEEQLHSEQRQVVAAQRALDAATSQTIAPFISERDAIAGRVASGAAKLDELARRRRMLLQLKQRESSLTQTQAALKQALARQRELGQTRLPRDEMIDRLGRRFSATLAALGYPKLENAYLQRNLVPVVRGKVYHRVGSSGAMTLVALAWQLAVFEEAIESGSGHPGFLLIDSPQKNLRRGAFNKPEGQAAPYDSEHPEGSPDGDDNAIAANSSTIVDRIYSHLSTWLEEHPEAQIILVDNEPPVGVVENVVVEYSADADNPPYGLIDDEDDRESPAAAHERQA